MISGCKVGYRAWFAEMRRLELPTWPTLETVCRSEADAAQARGCDRQVVRLALMAGLEVYQRVAT